jgi:lipoate-protein ligase A
MMKWTMEIQLKFLWKVLSIINTNQSIEGLKEISYRIGSMETWRLLDTGACPASKNMALDETLLELKAQERIPHTLRFLQFSNPTVLVGHHQSVEEEVRLDYCQKKRIEINRRLTGGGALYWGRQELGWEIYISKTDSRIPSKIEDLYRRMGRHLPWAFGISE